VGLENVGVDSASGRTTRVADAGPTQRVNTPRRNSTAEIKRKTFNRLGMMDLLMMAVEELYNSLLTGIGGLTILIDAENERCIFGICLLEFLYLEFWLSGLVTDSLKGDFMYLSH
jgi:hypothetical protein